jgi:DNA polymerase-3 subunit gamma/tau
MSSYVALARKYRPQDFSQLVGQDILVKILKNAIIKDKLHHAFILTGIRGVGKTTSARIIAKAINCLDKNSASSAISCNKCQNCISIANSNNQDVIEFDAASKTGVDDIRDIINSIAYSPINSKYKIYIIDEVHMLSNNAFNALLKTLEEPPANVKFIFATTEIKKVPITILSRCMRFNLRRLDQNEIIHHLQNILEKEGFKFDNSALELIAKLSEGSVRDSLSITDQILAANNYQSKVSTQEIVTSLGLNNNIDIINLLKSLFEGDVGKSLEIFNEFYSKSSDIMGLMKDLMSITHDIALLNIDKNHKIDALSSQEIAIINQISNEIDISIINRMWQMLQKNINDLNNFFSGKIFFEMLIIRICHLKSLPNLQQLLLNDKLEENKVACQNNNIKNNVVTNSNTDSDDLVSEILRNFEGSKLII